MLLKGWCHSSFNLQEHLYLSILTIIRAPIFLPAISWPRNHVQKHRLLPGDVVSAGRFHRCTKSEAFKVYQTLCLSVNELCSSRAIKLILPGAAGDTGRTGAADLLLHCQGSPGLWSMKQLRRRESRSASPGLPDAQESPASLKSPTILPRQYFRVEKQFSWWPYPLQCSEPPCWAEVFGELWGCGLAPQFLPCEQGSSDPTHKVCWSSWQLPSHFAGVGIRLVVFGMGVCPLVKSTGGLQEDERGANARCSFSMFLPHDCWQMWPMTNPWNMAVQTEMG